MGSLAILGIVSGCSIMPKPLTSEDRNARTAGDLKLIAQLEFVPVEPITLDQAIARAVAFNLQRWVKQIEREIEDAELQTKSFEMLPSLDLDAARNATNEELSARRFCRLFSEPGMNVRECRRRQDQRRYPGR